MDDTIVAVASAVGGAGRGIVRLSGPAVVSCLRQCFLPEDPADLSRSIAWSVPGRLRVAPPVPPLPCRVYFWPGTRSYTRQPTAEIHTLGSPPLLEAALQTLCETGARLAQPGEFTLRAFLAGRIDLPQAEAVLGVIDATSQRQLDVALTQLAGGLSARFHAARDQLLNLCADVEAGLDFVEEDLQFVTAEEIVRQLDDVLQVIQVALQQMESRLEVGHEPRIVLCGQPNVGKSTLWNRLLDHSVALVSATPGTTRDYLEDRLHLGQMECLLIDTAGLDRQPSPGPVDAASQQMTHRKRQQADLLLLCLDVTQPWSEGDFAPWISNSQRTVVLLTKFDQPQNTGLPPWLASLPEGITVDDRPSTVRLQLLLPNGQQVVEVLKTSGHTGFGIAALRQRIEQELLERAEAESSVVAGTAVRCRESLRRARAALIEARSLAVASAGDELLAVEIRAALTELGQVLGTIYTEDLLDRIFSRFCIGK
jgi:tRNA modification GTPase